MKNTEWIILKEKYPFKCAYCWESQVAWPSLFMQTWMMNKGGWSCLNCKKYNILEIDLETNEKMNSYTIDDYKNKETKASNL